MEKDSMNEKEKQEILRRVIKVADLNIRGKALEMIRKEITRMQSVALKQLEDAGVDLSEKEKNQFIWEIRDLAVEFLWGELRGRDF